MSGSTERLTQRPLTATPEAWDRIEGAAARQGLTLGQWVSLALAHYLEIGLPPRHTAGCPRGCGEPFMCTSCGLPFGACMGAADDRPDECDGCSNAGR